MKGCVFLSFLTASAEIVAMQHLFDVKSSYFVSLPCVYASMLTSESGKVLL